MLNQKKKTQRRIIVSIDEIINKVYLGDCIEFMKTLPDECVDLVVTDPPYGISYVNNHSQEQFAVISNDDFEQTKPLLEEYFKECFRIMKQDSAIYSFCSWHKVDFFIQEIRKHFTMKNLLIWDKQNHTNGDLEGSYGVSTELIVYAHKGRCLNRGKRYIDILSFPKENTKKIGHPTPKNVDLLKVFINNSSDKNDIVFDGFSGSGSTGVAAIQLGRKFIGSELDPTYHKLSQDRIDAEIYNVNTVNKLFSMD
jgi:site-specific DNA-methyltransferase (adenine-specific)